jgi:hypothetical protein
MIGFWAGVLFGFIDEEYITCPNCGGEFLPEEMRYEDDRYVCPACLKPLDEDEDSDVDRDEENGDEDSEDDDGED